MLKGKAEFFQVYANLPIPLRKEIIYVDDKPISWDVAYVEINSETPLAEKILKRLLAMKII